VAVLGVLVFALWRTVIIGNTLGENLEEGVFMTGILSLKCPS